MLVCVGALSPKALLWEDSVEAETAQEFISLSRLNSRWVGKRLHTHTLPTARKKPKNQQSLMGSQMCFFSSSS